MGNSCSANDTAAPPAAQSQSNGEAAMIKDDGQADAKQSQDADPQNGGSNPEQGNDKDTTANTFPSTHNKCRNDLYPKTDDVNRFNVPDDKVAWGAEYTDYKPVEFFAVQEIPIEEDPDFRQDDDPKVTWNTLDDHVNRKSHQGEYEVIGKVARNPVGRTGVCGRGRLARWGPNHAADPVVTRWKRDESGEVVKHDGGKPILQFISIQRADTNQWAIPGGFVDQGEEAIDALKREFCEEAMSSEDASGEQKQDMAKKLEALFKDGTEVYRGYVDDPRNTDEAWMETVVVNFHDDTGEMVGKLALKAGDDAIGVKWTDMDAGLDLYASHADFVQKVAELRQAAW